jgi:phosphonate transport system substrate-binding protein
MTLQFIRPVLPAIILALVLLPGRPAMAAETPALRFGIVPQQSASRLAQLWGPLLDHLGNASGIPLTFRTAPDIPEFERRCAAGEYDLAYMNPYHYTVFHRSPGYQAFARQQGQRIRGILVVRQDSPARALTDLAGQTLAFPAPAAFAASVLTRAALTRAGIPFTPKYVASHDSVYRTVAKGLYAGGGGIQRTFDNVDPAVREPLRVLWTSPGYTPHAFAAHPRVNAAQIARLQAAMLALAQDPRGRELLSGIGFTGIEAGEDSDWDDVRALGIDVLERLIRG